MATVILDLYIRTAITLPWKQDEQDEQDLINNAIAKVKSMFDEYNISVDIELCADSIDYLNEPTLEEGEK